MEITDLFQKGSVPVLDHAEPAFDWCFPTLNNQVYYTGGKFTINLISSRGELQLIDSVCNKDISGFHGCLHRGTK